MYDTRDELLREIQAGEDSHLDFKEVVFKGDQVRFARESDRAAMAMAKTLSCFANTDGGVVVLGVTDRGGIVGFDPAKADPLQRFVATAARDSVEPPLDNLLLLDNVLLPGQGPAEELVLKVEVRAARFSVHAPKGRRPYHRVGTTCSEMTMEQQARVLERRGQIHPFEERPAFTAPVDCLDQRRVAVYHERRFGQSLADAAVPYERLLRNLRLLTEDELGTPHPTVLGLLLFCPQPQEHIGGAYVDLVVYESEAPDADRQRDARRIIGTIPEQIEQCINYVATSPYLPTAPPRTGSAVGTTLPTHCGRCRRRSSTHSCTAITRSSARRCGSSCSPTASRSVARGFAQHAGARKPLRGLQPLRRNQMLAGFLREYVSLVTERAYMEARGEGFLMLVRESLEVSGRRPDLVEVGDSVRLIIFAGPPRE